MKKLILLLIALSLLLCAGFALAEGTPNCGDPNATGEIVHGTQEFQFDSTYHWTVCTICGTRFNRETHMSGDRIITETQHGRECRLCGHAYWLENHQAYCHSETQCISCGSTVSSADLIHNDECMGLVCFETVNRLCCRMLCQPGTPVVPHEFQSHRCVNCNAWDGGGDINGDAHVNRQDLLALARYLAGHRVFFFTEDYADVNRDGLIDMVDYQLLYEFFTLEGAGY